MDFLIEGITLSDLATACYVCSRSVTHLFGCKKDMEPSLLLPMGLGAILVNLPSSGVLNQIESGIGETNGIIEWLYDIGINTSEALPILLFIGIGAMIDFGPLLANPIMFLFGAAAQFGIFITIVFATLLGFNLVDASSIGIIGAADGPTSILVSQILGSQYFAQITVAAYSYGSSSNYPTSCHKVSYN